MQVMQGMGLLLECRVMNEYSCATSVFIQQLSRIDRYSWK